MADPGRLLHLADEMAGRAAANEGFAWLAVLAAHAALESLVNQLGRQEIGSFNERARFLPKWHDLCERTLGKQLDAAPDLERLHALRDGIAGFGGPPERLDRRSPAPPPEVPQALSVETARWAVDAARRVVEEFHRTAGRERLDWLGGARLIRCTGLGCSGELLLEDQGRQARAASGAVAAMRSLATDIG